ncbi:hypothetical protein GF319_01010 [Candidatus Bathyarchaeota archaeon]|jgi:hypothetical protein|nr:hypothetical protein [Candidatus Bathyarchaeota archaeon]
MGARFRKPKGSRRRKTDPRRTPKGIRDPFLEEVVSEEPKSYNQTSEDKDSVRNLH